MMPSLFKPLDFWPRPYQELEPFGVGEPPHVDNDLSRGQLQVDY